MAIFFIINLSSFSTSYNFRVVCLYYTIMIPSWKIQIVRKIILLRTVCIFGQFCKLELVGAQPLHLADARPFCRLHTPLGCALLNFIQQTRTCRSETPPSCAVRKTVPYSLFYIAVQTYKWSVGRDALIPPRRSLADCVKPCEFVQILFTICPRIAGRNCVKFIRITKNELSALYSVDKCVPKGLL